VRSEIKANDVKALSARIDESFFETAIAAYTANVAKGAKSSGTFAFDC